MARLARAAHGEVTLIARDFHTGRAFARCADPSSPSDFAWRVSRYAVASFG